MEIQVFVFNRSRKTEPQSLSLSQGENLDFAHEISPQWFLFQKGVRKVEKTCWSLYLETIFMYARWTLHKTCLIFRPYNCTKSVQVFSISLFENIWYLARVTTFFFTFLNKNVFKDFWAHESEVDCVLIHFLLLKFLLEKRST